MKVSPTFTIQRLHGYPQFLHELCAEIPPAAPDLLTGLFVLLRHEGMNISFADVDVLSGHATQFIYSREQPKCIELAIVPPVETLCKATQTEWHEYIPSGMDAAFDVIVRVNESGRPMLGRLVSPVLFYGYGGQEWERAVTYSALGEPSIEVIDALLECEQKLWRYPLDEGNSFIAVEAAPKQITVTKEHCHDVARRAVRMWKSAELAGCACGAAAYEAIIADIKDIQNPLCSGVATLWLEAGLEMQWRSRKSLAEFFERYSPRFGGAERKTYGKAGFYFQQCVDEWEKFQHLVQSGWSRDTIEKFEFDDARASSLIEQAAQWERKAVNELLRVIA